MTQETMLRAAAVLAAAALIATPYWPSIKAFLVNALGHAKAHQSNIVRVLAGLLILAAAWGAIPIPTLPTITPAMGIRLAAGAALIAYALYRLAKRLPSFQIPEWATDILLLALGVVVIAAPLKLPEWKVPQIVVTKATAAVYVYEKDNTGIPVAVAVGIDRLNRERQIVATMCEADAKDGTGQVPEQYALAIAEAKNAGLPALVVLSGSSVNKVVKNPQTTDDVLKAVP